MIFDSAQLGKTQNKDKLSIWSEVIGREGKRHTSVTQENIVKIRERKIYMHKKTDRQIEKMGNYHYDKKYFFKFTETKLTAKKIIVTV